MRRCSALPSRHACNLQTSLKPSVTPLPFFKAMDTSHVCLIALKLNADGFAMFRCDRPMTMGLHLGNLSKILRFVSGEPVTES